MYVAIVAAAFELALSNTYMHQDTGFNQGLCSKIRMIDYNSRYAHKVDTYVSGRFVGALKSYLAGAKFLTSGVDTPLQGR